MVILFNPIVDELEVVRNVWRIYHILFVVERGSNFLLHDDGNYFYHT